MLLSYLILLPISISFFLYCMKSGKLVRSRTVRKYGNLYPLLRQNKKRVSSRHKYHLPIKLTYRLIYTSLPVIFYKNITFQLQALIISTLLHICIQIGTKPFDRSRIEHWLIISSECIFLILCYYMMLFTDFISSFEDKFKIGYFLIYLLAALFLANFAVLLEGVLRSPVIMKHTFYKL
jgi:hypothetical protein